jgi:hypothetical protein
MDNTHLVNDLKPVGDLVKYLSQMTSVVSTCSRVHSPGARSSIQCPVMAKYESVLSACHASQVRLISPPTVGP